MSAMGQDLDSTIALFTAANEILQDASSTGTALRSMSLRVRGFDEETQELSDDLVGITGKIIDLTKTAEKPMGVSLFTDETQTEYKDFVQYFKELSEVWDDMSAKNQTALLNNLFGKRGAQAGSAIIKNYSQVEAAMNKMANSAGNADAEMEIITQSLSYKLNELKETGTGIFQNLFQRGDMGYAISGLTSLLSVLDKFTETFGLFGTIMAGAGISNGVMRLVNAFKDLSSAGESTNWINVLYKAFPPLQKSIKAGVSAFDNGASAAVAFGTGLKTLAASILPVAVALALLTAGTIAFNKTHTQWTQAQDAMSKAVNEYKSAQDEVDSLQNKVNDNTNSVKEIATKYNVDTTGLDTAQEIIDKIVSENEKGNIHLSLVDEAELGRLSQTNSELETQIGLQEKLARAKHEAVITSTRQAAQVEKSYWEEVRGRHGEGIFGTIASGLDYIFTNKSGSIAGGYIDNKGNVYDQPSTSEGEKFAQRDTTTLGLARTEFEEYKNLKEELDSLNNEILQQDGEITKSQTEKKEKLVEDLKDSTSALSDYITSLTEQADILSDSPLSSDKEMAKDMRDFMVEFQNFGLSDAEAALNNINNFFDGSIGKNTLREALIDASEEGRNLNDVLNEMGLSLSDLNLENNADGLKYLEEYFGDITKEVENTKSALKDFRVDVEGVKKATESANQDADWSTIQSAYKAAKELNNEGKTGVDDYKSVAQFFSSKNLSYLAEKAKEAGGYASDVYQQAFKEAQAKADRWFGEDEDQSLMNFADDMQSKGMFTIDKSDEKGLWDIKSNFESTAEAANAMGISVGAVETLLSGLEAYGYDFGNIEKSSAMLDDYQVALDGLNQTYNEMEDGAAKNRLGDLLNGKNGFNEQYDTILQDLENLSKEQVIHIQFEYDLAQLQMDIDNLKKQTEAGGSSEDHAALIVKQQDYIEKLTEGLGFNQEGIKIPVELEEAQASEASARDNLLAAIQSGDTAGILKYQMEVENAQEEQKRILDEFAEAHPEITPETDVEKINKAIEESHPEVTPEVNTKEIEESHPEVTPEVNMEKIEESEAEVKVDADTSDVESEIQDTVSNTPTVEIDFHINLENLRSEVEGEKNQEGTFDFKGNLEDVKEQVDAQKEQSGTITFTTKINGDGLSGSTEDTTVNVTANTTGTEQVKELGSSVGALEPKTIEAKADVIGTGEVKSLGSAVGNLSSKTITITTIHKTVNQTVAGVDGTAHVNGTAFAQGDWGTKTSGVALGGELGRKYFASAYSNVCEKLII